jgi:hypothetical protein
VHSTGRGLAAAIVETRLIASLQEWRGYKYVDGIYAVSNSLPDLEIVFTRESRNIKDTGSLPLHNNPAKAGIVTEPHHYLHSSAQPDRRLDVLEIV